MEEIIVPVIRPKDYDAMWRLTNGDVPDTYEEWRDLHTKRKIERRQRGGVVIEVEVFPKEFAEFCEARGLEPDESTLEGFAVEEAKRQHR